MYRIVPAWQRDVVFIDTEEVERRLVLDGEGSRDCNGLYHYRNRDLETKLKDSYQVFQCRKNELAKQLRDRLHEREQYVSNSSSSSSSRSLYTAL